MQVVVQLLLQCILSCERNHLGGINGLSEVSGDDDVRTVLRFLYRVLCLEMHQLWRHYRPDYFQESPNESGGPRIPTGCREVGILTYRAISLSIWRLVQHCSGF
jgi:hypothetical protein